MVRTMTGTRDQGINRVWWNLEDQRALALEALPAITRHLVEHGALVYAVQPQRQSLEELFIQIVGTDGGL